MGGEAQVSIHSARKFARKNDAVYATPGSEDVIGNEAPSAANLWARLFIN